MDIFAELRGHISVEERILLFLRVVLCVNLRWSIRFFDNLHVSHVIVEVVTVEYVLQIVVCLIHVPVMATKR